MKVTIELMVGPNSDPQVLQSDIQKNIDSLQRAIDCKSVAGDFVSLMDTKSILEGIQRKLKGY